MESGGGGQTRRGERSRAREALEELCRAYWYPLYAFVRYRGYSSDDAQDLTQAFFARIIETVDSRPRTPGAAGFAPICWAR